MFGLHRGFSVDVVGGRSLVLHGLAKGSMLGTGRRDAGRFSHFLMAVFQTQSSVFLIFSMSHWQVLSSKIRSLPEEGAALLFNVRGLGALVTHLRFV